jgi:hypothetical protein
VNLLLPDELEAELQLRERIANKTLAIDFTLGLEQGTGAEADWMAEYRYQGISALNAWQGDRAIEQIAGYQQRLRRLMAERGIDAEWLAAWNGWLREVGGRQDDRILAWAQLGRKGGEATEYTRQLQPRLVDGVPHWLWTTAKPADSLLNFWLALDSKTFPAATRTDLPSPRRLAPHRRRGSARSPRGASSTKTPRSKSWATCAARSCKVLGHLGGLPRRRARPPRHRRQWISTPSASSHRRGCARETE